QFVRVRRLGKTLRAVSVGLRAMVLISTIACAGAAAGTAAAPAPQRHPEQREGTVVAEPSSDSLRGGQRIPDLRPASARNDSGGHSRFYRSLGWGSEAQFNPLTELLNEGFDQL